MTQTIETVLIDSLPYYDNDIDQNPELRQKVEQELARETKPQSSLHPKVPPAFTLFEVQSTYIQVTF